MLLAMAVEKKILEETVLLTFGKYVFLISLKQDFGLNESECKININ